MSAVSRTIPILALAGAVFASVVPATAAGKTDKPTVLGTVKDWTAYTRTTPDGKVCYALSKPASSNPQKIKRDPVYVLINDWPSRKVKGEIQIVPGYPYREGAPVTATVGKLSVDFFSKNDGNSGSAWVKNPGDEGKLLDAMRKGSKLVVSGTSKRGTNTKDTYSLSGLVGVLDKMRQVCK